MALKPYERYAPLANEPDNAYPYGSVRNETTQGADDGTPLDADSGNDYIGADAALFNEAGITPSGTPDNVLTSDRLDAHKIVAGKSALRPVLISQGYTGEIGYFSRGFTINDSNDVGVTDSGQVWKYIGSDPLPLVVAAGTVPSAPDWGEVTFNDHNATVNRNVVGAHDAIYQRVFTTLENLKLGIDATGQTIPLNDLVGSNVKYLGGFAEGDGLSGFGRVKSGGHTDDGFRIISLAPNIYLEVANPNLSGFDRAISKQGVKPEMIAHRGFRDLSMQNTMLALTTAISRGADSLECDVQISSDGVPMLFHDTTVDTLTDGTGNFSSLTEAQIKALRFDKLLSTVYADEQIPTFREFLDYAKKLGVFIYPEIKGYRTQADIDLILNEIYQAGMEDKTMLQSFQFSDIQYVRAKNNQVYVGFLDTFLDLSLVDQLSGMGRSAALVQYTNVISNPSWVDYCYSKGVDIGVWTVNDVQDAETLLSLGVTKIMSDFNVLAQVQK